MTVPSPQVPPATIENVPGPETWVMPGAVLRVTEPVRVLVTVMIPVSVAVLAVVGASVGLGALKVSEPATSVQVLAALVPAGLVTVTFRLPSEALDGTENVALICVSLTTVNELTVTAVPVPLVMLTAVAPVKSTPIRTTGTRIVDVPRLADGGAMEVRVVPSTVNVVVAEKPLALTVTVCAPSGALTAMVKVVVMVVAVVVRAPTVMPVPAVTDVTPARFVPLMVTDTV